MEVILCFMVLYQVPGIYWEGWLSILLAVALRFRNIQVLNLRVHSAYGWEGVGFHIITPNGENIHYK